MVATSPVAIVESNFFYDNEAEQVPHSGSKGRQVVAHLTPPPLHQGPGCHVEENAHHGDIETAELESFFVFNPAHLSRKEGCNCYAVVTLQIWIQILQWILLHFQI